MSNSNLHPPIGLGLRNPHLDFFQKNPNYVSWLEIHSENFFENDSPSRHQLRAIRLEHQISCHGVGLSLGSASPINNQHLMNLKNLVDELQPCFVSDHLSWSESGGVHFNDLLPLPYTEEALQVFSDNVCRVQDEIQRPLLIENPSSYLQFKHSTIDEWEFLNAVQQRTDCKLLLDINNIYVSSMNHGFCAQDYLLAINSNAVAEIHLAGFTVKELSQGKVWIDTHSRPVSEEVWKLYRTWCALNPNTPTLIEWDLDIPAPEILLNEAIKASKIATSFSSMKAVS